MERVSPRPACDCVIYLYCYLALASALRQAEPRRFRPCVCVRACVRTRTKQNKLLTYKFFLIAYLARTRASAQAEIQGCEKKAYDGDGEGRREGKGGEPFCGDASYRSPRPAKRAGNRENWRTETWNVIWRSARSGPGQNGGGWKARGGKPRTIDPPPSRSLACSVSLSLSLSRNDRIPPALVRRVWTMALKSQTLRH